MDNPAVRQKVYCTKTYVNRKRLKFANNYMRIFKSLPGNDVLPKYRWKETRNRIQANANDDQAASSSGNSGQADSDSDILSRNQNEEMDAERDQQQISVLSDSDDGNENNDGDDNDDHDDYTNERNKHMNGDDDDDDDGGGGGNGDDGGVGGGGNGGGGGDGDSVYDSDYGDNERGNENNFANECAGDDDGGGDGDDDDNGSDADNDDDGGGDDDYDDNGSDADNNDDDDDISAFNIQEGPIITMRPNVREHEILISIMAVSERHKLSFESTLAVIKLFKTFSNYNNLPTTKSALWKKLGRAENNSQKKYIYCKKCKAVIGIGKVPVQNCPCRNSGPEKPLSRTSLFIKLDVTKQLQRIFSKPNILHLLNYRNNREKIDPNGIEYLFDGDRYRKMQREDEFLNSNWNFSLSINTDGCQVGKSSKQSAWPILLAINELPPHARKNFIILAAIWVDNEHPDFNVYMPPIIEELRQLYEEGFEWSPNGMERVRSKFVTTICTCDTPARAKILNTTSYNGLYGCNFCYAPGIAMENGSRKYPIENIVDRTDAQIRKHMRRANRKGIRQKGLIGDSPLKYVPEFDLRRGVVVDSMHCIDIGVVKKLTEMIIFGNLTDNWFRANARIRRIIDERLTQIRTPNTISRKPRSIELCKLWKASEWRNWILYYCIPCLIGLIPDEYFILFCMISEAMHVLNGDSITNEQLERATALINDFEIQYEQIFGIKNMTTNMHLLRHLPDTVKCWGPVWAHNAYAFESFNNKILKSLNSSTGRSLQIINRYLLNDFITTVSSDPNMNEIVKYTVRNILNTGKKLPVRNDVAYNHYYKFRHVGKSNGRYPHDWETLLLHQKGLTVDNNELSVHKKAIVKGIMYTSEYSDKGNTRNCDKYVYTRDGKFAEILNIVTFAKIDDRRVVNGMFVKWFEDTNDMAIGKHIKSLLVSTKDFITEEEVRLPAIVIKMNDKMYGVKVANPWETD